MKQGTDTIGYTTSCLPDNFVVQPWYALGQSVKTAQRSLKRAQQFNMMKRGRSFWCVMWREYPIVFMIEIDASLDLNR